MAKRLSKYSSRKVCLLFLRRLPTSSQPSCPITELIVIAVNPWVAYDSEQPSASVLRFGCLDLPRRGLRSIARGFQPLGAPTTKKTPPPWSDENLALPYRSDPPGFVGISPAPSPLPSPHRGEGERFSPSRRQACTTQAFRLQHLAPFGERSANGRVRGGPPRDAT